MAEKSKLEAALDELLTGKLPEVIAEPGGVLKQLTKARLEGAKGAELSNHLGYEKLDSVGRGSASSPSLRRDARQCFRGLQGDGLLAR